MDNVKYEYDMTKLLESSEFDAKAAVGNFCNQQEYFDMLTEYAEKSSRYLQSYNPIVVIHSDIARKEFLTELDGIKRITLLLEMAFVVTDIKNLEVYVNKNDIAGLTGGLKFFSAKLEIMKGVILSARNMPPESNAATTPSSESASGMQPENVKKAVIMAVDDRPEILTLVTGMLEGIYRVIVVASPSDAIKALQVHSPDLFLIDIEMPEITGYELADIIRQDIRFTDVPVIFMTSQMSREYVFIARERGASDYILKPIDRNTLLNKLKRHIKG